MRRDRRDLRSRADHLDKLALASGKRDINSKIIAYSYRVFMYLHRRRHRLEASSWRSVSLRARQRDGQCRCQ